MKQLKKGQAMQCFGKLVEIIERDPDPKIQSKLKKEYGCKNCNKYLYCCVLADALVANSPYKKRE